MRFVLSWLLLCVFAVPVHADEDTNYLLEIADANYQRGKTRLAEARAFAKQGDAERAAQRYDAAVDRIDVVYTNFKEVLQRSPKLMTLAIPTGAGGTMTAKAMLDDAVADLNAARAEREANEAKAREQGRAARDQTIKSLAGDRARLYREHGNRLPTWFDGSTLADLEARRKALLTAARWGYVSGNGCEETFHFSRNKMVRRETKPAGCQW